MELYLIRHGQAGDRQEYSNDEIRPLTEKGRAKTAKVAQRLYELGVKFDIILTSPLVRARDTALILQKAELGENSLEFPPLAPDGAFQAWLDWYLDSPYQAEYNRVALVGHQPDLGNWAEILLTGNIREQLVLKKSGIVGLMLPPNINPVGRSLLFLLTSPKWFIC